MLFDPARHEQLQAFPWDEDRIRACIAQIVADAEARFTPQGWWPSQPRDMDPGEDASQPATPLYYGACDDVLVAAGEAVWAAGPLNKGSNLSHGTGGNGGDPGFSIDLWDRLRGRAYFPTLDVFYGAACDQRSGVAA